MTFTTEERKKQKHYTTIASFHSSKKTKQNKFNGEMKISSIGRKTEEHELNNDVVWFILSHKFLLCFCYTYF